MKIFFLITKYLKKYLNKDLQLQNQNCYHKYFLIIKFILMINKFLQQINKKILKNKLLIKNNYWKIKKLKRKDF